MVTFAEIMREVSSFFTPSSVLLLGVFFVLVYIFLDLGRPKDFPPGPPILPLIGSLPFTGTPSSKNFFKLKKKYGKIIGFKMFNLKAVILNDTDVIKEAMHQIGSTGRPPIYFLKIRNKLITHKDNVENIGILGTWGPNWQEQRRFVLKNLRDLGFGKTSHEPLMNEEMLELMACIEEQGGQPIPLLTLFNRTVLNVLWAMVMGKRYSYSDPELQDVIDQFDKFIRTMNPVSPITMVPGLGPLVRYLPSFVQLEEALEKIIVFVKGELFGVQQAHEGSEPGDHLVGAYLDAIEKNKGKESHLDKTQLMAIVVELFVAGSETTSSTLNNGIQLMTKHPEVQTRVQKELEAVVGLGNMPSFDHMDKVPYTLATIYEIQRFTSLVPISIPHAALYDFNVQGFRIPKGTLIFPHLESSNKDLNRWKFPNTFNPENFLDGQGNFVKNEAFMPFGNGRRQCAGEPLARLELFLIFTCLLHKFTFSLAASKDLPSDNPLIYRPPVSYVYANKRF
ncbi:cytochrome P450 2D20-like [Oratosquilla oratoria]|uniref:cytochrome P450 2D20-like n=1 Tax=Oratosquilla oratoria TaxID=337810 RepID=UPI003F764BBB